MSQHVQLLPETPKNSRNCSRRPVLKFPCCWRINIWIAFACEWRSTCSRRHGFSFLHPGYEATEALENIPVRAALISSAAYLLPALTGGRSRLSVDTVLCSAKPFGSENHCHNFSSVLQTCFEGTDAETLLRLKPWGSNRPQKIYCLSLTIDVFLFFADLHKLVLLH